MFDLSGGQFEGPSLYGKKHCCDVLWLWCFNKSVSSHGLEVECFMNLACCGSVLLLFLFRLCTLRVMPHFLPSSGTPKPWMKSKTISRHWMFITCTVSNIDQRSKQTTLPKTQKTIWNNIPHALLLAFLLTCRKSQENQLDLFWSPPLLGANRLKVALALVKAGTSHSLRCAASKATCWRYPCKALLSEV